MKHTYAYTSFLFVFSGEILQSAGALCQIVFRRLYNLFGYGYDFYFYCFNFYLFYRHLKQNRGNGADQLVA